MTYAAAIAELLKMMDDDTYKPQKEQAEETEGYDEDDL